MSEGSLEAPTRHPLEWHDPDFFDWDAINAEMRRVFDICHGCRRCFNLCDSFPRLFDMVDASPTEELDSVPDAAFKTVVDACTLCDMCYMTKCPYVPPHPFNLDFPHLMLRYRAAEALRGNVPLAVRELTKTDRNGRLAALVAPLANWATDTANTLTRPVMEKLCDIDCRAELPKYTSRPFSWRTENTPAVAQDAPAFGRKAVLYATCFVNYNNPDIGQATRAVLALNGVETEVLHPACCGMPQLEQGDLAAVAERARKVSSELLPWVRKGYKVIALVPSCALMLKSEWPLVLPNEPDIRELAAATFDVSEYVVDIARNEGLAPGLGPLPGSVTVHIACHARAQNIGQKAVDLLKLAPEADIAVIERCSGHGGSWGVMKQNFETALKVGKPVARQAIKNDKTYVVSECPLAAVHIRQGMDILREDLGQTPPPPPERQIDIHPIQLLAKAYGLA